MELSIYYILFLILLLIILSMQFPFYSSILYIIIIFIVVGWMVKTYYGIENQKRDSYRESQQKEIDDEIFSILHLV
jgi:Ca2+/Na+ antiporter